MRDTRRRRQKSPRTKTDHRRELPVDGLWRFLQPYDLVLAVLQARKHVGTRGARGPGAPLRRSGYLVRA
jgi:hypothetical protein